MNLKSFRPILESAFKDKMSGKHYESVTNEDETISKVLPEKFSYTDLPCKLSFPKPELPNDSQEDNIPIQVNIKIFCKYDSPISSGDLVTASVVDNDGVVLATYTGTIGLPNMYDTHQEVLLTIKESA